MNNINEELTDKTIRPTDKIKVARVIADMLGVEKAESMSPDQAVNLGLRKIKNKRMTPEFINTVKKMVTLAQEVGIKVDTNALPQVVNESSLTKRSQSYYDGPGRGRLLGDMSEKDHIDAINYHGTQMHQIKTGTHKYSKAYSRSQAQSEYNKHHTARLDHKDALDAHNINKDAVNKDSTYNSAKDILRFKDFKELSKINQGEVEPEQAAEKDAVSTSNDEPTKVGSTIEDPSNDQLRRRKVEYKLGEETELDESGPFSYGSKPSRKGSLKDQMAKQRKKYWEQLPVIEPKDQMIGNAKIKTNEETLDELSNELLHRYKEKANDDASAADKRGDFARGNKRFSGIIKATKKQFANDARGVKDNHTDALNHYRGVKEEIELDEDMHSADYKINPQTGRKYRARHITFAASKEGGSPVEGDDQGGDELNSVRRVRTAPLLKKVTEETESHEEISDEDLDDMIDDIDSEDDILDLYDEDELVIVDEDSGEEIKEDLDSDLDQQLNEVLSRQERMRAKIRFARSSAKRSHRLKIALKRHSSVDKINSRARTLAIQLIKRRLSKKNPSEMSVSEKERVEKIVAKRKKLIDRLAMKLVPRIRKIEQTRLSHSKVTKKA